MSARDRSLLHANKADEFASWLVGRGWIREAPKGYYEALRLRDPKGAVHSLYKRDRTDHLTLGWDTARVITPLVREWMRERRAET